MRTQLLDSGIKKVWRKKFFTLNLIYNIVELSQGLELEVKDSELTQEALLSRDDLYWFPKRFYPEEVKLIPQEVNPEEILIFRKHSNTQYALEDNTWTFIDQRCFLKNTNCY